MASTGHSKAPPFSADKALKPCPPATSPSPTIPLSPAIPPRFANWGKTNLSKFLDRELDLHRLERIQKYLWIAGRANHIRSLHKQKLMGREVIITEKHDLHLVWHDSRVYIKPLPEFLLNHRFFAEYLCNNESYYKSACGLLLSYTKLICHESDFLLAKEANLFPSTFEVDWNSWCAFSDDIQSKITVNNTHERYLYGDLRLARLNTIYQLRYGKYRGFHHQYTEYTSFFRRNFHWLLMVFAYLSILLSTMQIMLVPGIGPTNLVTPSVSYGFSVFAFVTAVAVLAIVLLMFFMFAGLLLVNLVVTLRHDQAEHENLKKQEVVNFSV